MAKPKPRSKWRRLVAGAYADGAGGLHVYPSEFLMANGYADTPANRDHVLQTWTELVGPNMRIIPEPGNAAPLARKDAR